MGLSVIMGNDEVAVHNMYEETVKTEGVKYSDTKPKISMLFTQFPDALKAVTLASMFGHIKYEEFDKDFLNYKRVAKENAYLDAGLRHHMLESSEQEESKLHPKFHVAWNALADLQLYIEQQGIDIQDVANINIPLWKEEFKK